LPVSTIESKIMTVFNRLIIYALVFSTAASWSSAFSVLPSQKSQVVHILPTLTQNSKKVPFSRVVVIGGSESGNEEATTEAAGSKLTPEEVIQVGNLVADDEWMGLSMELSEMVRTAVIEDTKKNVADFIAKDNYKVGDISKEIDSRVKGEVAKMRGKDDYELGDLSVALDTLSKEMTCELTGKEDYEFGDLSTEIDTRIKSKVAEYCGNDTYELGDLSKEINKRTTKRLNEFIGKEEYEFGDITREINARRVQWVSNFLGEEAAKDYEFGDITKRTVTNYTGKNDYEFGDVTKKVLGDLFGKRKRGGKE